MKNASVSQSDKYYQEANDKCLLITIDNNTLPFYCATIRFLVTILDSQVKKCPLGTCQFYLLTAVVAEAKNLTWAFVLKMKPYLLLTIFLLW